MISGQGTLVLELFDQVPSAPPRRPPPPLVLELFDQAPSAPPRHYTPHRRTAARRAPAPRARRETRSRRRGARQVEGAPLEALIVPVPAPPARAARPRRPPAPPARAARPRRHNALHANTNNMKIPT